jgi:hypothetical protein
MSWPFNCSILRASGSQLSGATAAVACTCFNFACTSTHFKHLQQLRFKGYYNACSKCPPSDYKLVANHCAMECCHCMHPSLFPMSMAASSMASNWCLASGLPPWYTVNCVQLHIKKCNRFKLLPTAPGRVRAQVRSCGIYGGQSGTGTVFSEYFGFPCQISFHWLLHFHHDLSSGAGIIGQLVAGEPSGLSITPPEVTKKKKTVLSLVIEWAKQLVHLYLFIFLHNLHSKILLVLCQNAKVLHHVVATFVFMLQEENPLIHFQENSCNMELLNVPR